MRSGRQHRYIYTINSGVVGPADGVGFVFDKRIVRSNIQNMRSIFLNSHGQVCKRNRDQISKVASDFPPLTVGCRIQLCIDLDHAQARFDYFAPQAGSHSGDLNPQRTSVSLGFEDLLQLEDGSRLQTGFFCVVVTNYIQISLY